MNNRSLLKTGRYLFTAVFFISVLWALPLYAADVPNTFSNGTTASADEVNTNFKFLSDRSWDKSKSRGNPEGASCPETVDNGCECPAGTTWIDDDASVGVPGDAIVQDGECEQLSLVIESRNIGVGTTTPKGQLDIKADTANAPGNIFFRSTTNDSASSGFRLVWRNLADNTDVAAITGVNDAFWSSYLSFSTLDTVSQALKERVRIDNKGNVGIGISNPGAKLQVSGGKTILEQEDWISPTLLNNWVTYNNEYNPPGYFKDSMGIVHLRGLVKWGTIGTAIFVLPPGYRPEFRELHVVKSGSNLVSGRCDIAANGNVIAYAGNTSWFFSLDGITFRAIPATTVSFVNQVEFGTTLNILR